MEAYGHLIGELRGRAAFFLRSLTSRASTHAVDDVVGETLVRLLKLKAEGKVCPDKGTEQALANGILRLVAREHARRALRNWAEPLHDCHWARDNAHPINRLIDAEHLAALSDGWDTLTPREQTALLKVAGPLFGRSAAGRPINADRVAASRALKKLIEFARRRGMIDGH